MSHACVGMQGRASACGHKGRWPSLLVGRRDNQIKTAGFRVSPTEVEQVLSEHAAVAQAAVVGAPDPLLGALIVAFVTARLGAEVDARELSVFSARRLPNHMIPKVIIKLDALPTTSSGKIDYAQLRTLATVVSPPDHSEVPERG